MPFIGAVAPADESTAELAAEWVRNVVRGHQPGAEAAAVRRLNSSFSRGLNITTRSPASSRPFLSSSGKCRSIPIVCSVHDETETVHRTVASGKNSMGCLGKAVTTEQTSSAAPLTRTQASYLIQINTPWAARLTVLTITSDRGVSFTGRSTNRLLTNCRMPHRMDE